MGELRMRMRQRAHTERATLGALISLRGLSGRQIDTARSRLRDVLHDIKGERWRDAWERGSLRRRQWMRHAWEGRWGGTLFDDRRFQREIKNAYAGVLPPIDFSRWTE